MRKKFEQSEEQFYSDLGTSTQEATLLALDYYQEMLIKHIDLVERRLIKGETIPHEDKFFSIFESHTEWIKKGKANNKVEIGHKILIATDQSEKIPLAV